MKKINHTFTTFIFFAIFLMAAATCEDKPSEQELSGFDISGKEASCLPMGEKACTEIYTEGDRFATECRKRGHVAIQCDCHEFLCDTKDGKPLKFE